MCANADRWRQQDRNGGIFLEAATAVCRAFKVDFLCCSKCACAVFRVLSVLLVTKMHYTQERTGCFVPSSARQTKKVGGCFCCRRFVFCFSGQAAACPIQAVVLPLASSAPPAVNTESAIV